MIRDDFGGPGGWDEGLRLLGCDELVVGLEWDVAACATRAAAGHTTIRCDIAAQPVEPWVGRVDGYTGSPPCQLWSNAGSKAGHGAIDLIADAMADLLAGRDSRPAVRAAAAESIRASGNEKLAARADELAYQAALMLEPARAIGALRPRWVALEQVPSVLPLWERLAHGLRELGYSAWCGILNAADYGVPQTRRRAILMASLDREVGPPPPTHAERPEPSLFGDELQPWVSMAEALGWGGRVGFPRLDDRGDSPGGYRERDWRSADLPAQVVTEKARSWQHQPNWVDVRRGPREGDQPGDVLGEGFDPTAEPAQTVTSRIDRWQLNTGRDWKPGGSRADAQRISEDRPAPAVTGKSGAWEWQEEAGELPLLQQGGGYENGSSSDPRRYDGSNRRLYDPAEEPAPTLAFGHDTANWQWRERQAVEAAAAEQRRQLVERLEQRRNDQSHSGEGDPLWPLDRPATTIAGRDLVPDPGTNAIRFNGAQKSRNDGYRVTASEAAVLQGFDPAYPWQGTKTAQFTQIGNAIPPPLAAAILAVLL